MFDVRVKDVPKDKLGKLLVFIAETGLDYDPPVAAGQESQPQTEPALVAAQQEDTPVQEEKPKAKSTGKALSTLLGSTPPRLVLDHMLNNRGVSYTAAEMSTYLVSLARDGYTYSPDIGSGTVSKLAKFGILVPVSVRGPKNGATRYQVSGLVDDDGMVDYAKLPDQKLREQVILRKLCASDVNIEELSKRKLMELLENHDARDWTESKHVKAN